MGSNGFSSERKHKRVDLLKQLLDTNISTQGSSNPLEALISGLDLGSLEGLMQKNKKSHHDDWDSKKKRHHDDCNDHDWDHKKKHDHDDCGCKKKKHDHDDCCDCKDKKCCKCSCVDAAAVCNLIGLIFAELNNAASAATLRSLLTQLSSRLSDCKIKKGLLIRLTNLINELPTSGTVGDILIGRITRFLEDLLECLGFEVGDCGSGGGGGGGTCTCPDDFVTTVCGLIVDIRAVLAVTPVDRPALIPLITNLAAQVSLFGSCISQGIRASLLAIIAAILGGASPFGGLSEALDRLAECLGCTSGPPTVPVPPPTTLVSTIRQRLLDLLADQVVITTPTGIYGGTLVAVQADYIAVVAPTGTYLIALDQIQTFTTE